MATPRIRPSVGLALALAAALAAPVQAQNREAPDDWHVFVLDHETNDVFHIDHTVEGRNGQRFHVEGDLHVTVNVRREGDHSLNVDVHANPAGLTITKVGGETYRVVGSSSIHGQTRNVRDSGPTFDRALEFGLVSPGPGPNYDLRIPVRGRIARNGELSLAVTAPRVEERGGDGNQGGHDGR